ncbi:MAG: cysteine desulfurase family protein [Flavobacteriales bacterium]
MKVYLDNAATTPVAPEVVEAMMPYLTEHFGNPSSSHAFGRKTKTAIEQSRRTIARLLNCTPAEIYFTSGGTEADNLAMHAALNDLGCTHIITSPTEHSAVLKTAQQLAARNKAALSMVQLDTNGSIDMQHLESLLASEAKSFVTLMHANNEVGNMIDLTAVSELCAKYGAVFHSDTVQTMGHYPMDLQKLSVQFLNASAHKFHGPKGTGFIYIDRTTRANATITGGGQERGLRGGTENLYGIVGMAKALELCYTDMAEHEKHVSGLKQLMVEQLTERIPGITFNGLSATADSLYTVLSCTLPENANADTILFLLDLEGVACSGGSACSSGAAKGSHVLEAIGALRTGCASVRFSFSRNTTIQEVEYAVNKLAELCSVPVDA